jgi:hypothetical protein
MAPHAHRSGGNARVGGPIRAGMAVQAIDSIVADVMTMVELDWLHD